MSTTLNTTLSVEGTGMVHLTGFTVRNNEDHLGYGPKAFPDEYYDDNTVEEEQFTVKMEDTRELSGDWEDSSDLPEVSSEASFTDQQPHVIAVSDSEPAKANEMESPSWQKVPENTIIPAQTDYQEQSMVGPTESVQANSSQITQLSPTHRNISNNRNRRHSLPSQFLQTADMRRTPSFGVRPQQGHFKNRRKMPAKPPKAASAHKAEEEAIEARRRRWRLAKREQRKKIKEKTYDTFFYQSNNQEFFSTTPGPSTTGSLQIQQNVNEPVEDFYQVTATSSDGQFASTGVVVEDDFKPNSNSFGNT
ncbi:uncharacterized protein [Apostichopus japonicus]|uniref:uncharacterized protein isoform X2 n=1 Tax=Stichopus japonicus TaxID=307972 RepID=UPI003AB4EFF3